MNDFLRKINLIKDINIKLNVSKIDFTKKFRDNVDESNLGFEPFEALQSSQNEYKGNIYNNNFELKKRRKFFDSHHSFAKVTGVLIEENEQLTIKAEINGFKKRMILFFGLMVMFYLIFICGSLFFEDKNAFPIVVLPFILIHMCLMLGLPYFFIRRSVNKMAYDLERDFHYWIIKM